MKNVPVRIVNVPAAILLHVCTFLPDNDPLGLKYVLAVKVSTV
jgi:hypothetical protein